MYLFLRHAVPVLTFSRFILWKEFVLPLEVQIETPNSPPHLVQTLGVLSCPVSFFLALTLQPPCIFCFFFAVFELRWPRRCHPHPGKHLTTPWALVMRTFQHFTEVRCTTNNQVRFPRARPIRFTLFFHEPITLHIICLVIYNQTPKRNFSFTSRIVPSCCPPTIPILQWFSRQGESTPFGTR